MNHKLKMLAAGIIASGVLAAATFSYAQTWYGFSVDSGGNFVCPSSIQTMPWWFGSACSWVSTLANAVANSVKNPNAWSWLGINPNGVNSQLVMTGGQMNFGGHPTIRVDFTDAQGDIVTLQYCSNGHYTGFTVQSICTSPPNKCGLTGTGMETNHDPATCTAKTPPDGVCSVLTNCPTHEHWDGTQNQCVNDNCAAGYHWDTNQNKCVPPMNCSADQHWDATVNACVLNNCATGSHWDINQNQCVSNSQSSTACPIGYVGTAPNCTLASSCPIGYTGTPPHCTCAPMPICSGNDVVDSCTGALSHHCNYSCGGGVCTFPAPQVVIWNVVPLLVKSGKTVTAAWDARYVSSCTVTDTIGDSWTGLSGSEVSSPISAQTVFTLHCKPILGSGAADVTRTATVNIAPTFHEE